MKEKVIKINKFNLILAGTSLASIFVALITNSNSSILSYIAVILIGSYNIVAAFDDNEDPFQAMKQSFNYIFRVNQ